MTTSEYKEQLIQKYNETVVALQQIQGAIAACDELLKSQEEPTSTFEEEPTDE
jgi:hypothetical protein|tara:strand:+ start:9476 stop:9634 length:159 start_codon:yes stop_codon:yes gene_type:complete